MALALRAAEREAEAEEVVDALWPSSEGEESGEPVADTLALSEGVGVAETVPSAVSVDEPVCEWLGEQ